MKQLVLLYFIISAQGAFCQEQFNIFFDSNKFEVSKSELSKIQAWIKVNSDAKIVAINGFTDEDGTNRFNDSLAKKRVQSVLNIVKNKIKIRDDFKSRSFGENFAQSKIKFENRKVTVFFILKKDLFRENEILKIQTIENKPIVKTPKIFPGKVSFENPDGSVLEFQLDNQFMKTIDEAKVGEKLKLDNLNFEINTFIITNKSRPKLFELLTVLQQNPKLKIEIQGNLCCQPIDRVNLSTERAKAIYSFLTYHKIEKNRLTYKGFGSTNPIFELPEKNEEERAANRRVEILILENE